MEENKSLNSTDNNFDIAIIGMSCRFPGAKNIDEFWKNLANGVESIARLSDEEIKESGVDTVYLNNPDYVKASPILEGPGLFDAGFFGFTPKEAKEMDPQHRILLECAYEALEYAGYDPERYNGPIGVYTGSAMNTYFMHSGLRSKFADEYIPTLIGNDKDFLSTRISYKLNLKGPSINVQTACSTSLVAVHLACQSLISEESDMALAGAISIRVPHVAGYVCDGGGIVSADGHVKAFDANANGTVFGSGGGIIVLKRLSDAIADGDTIHAVIKGSAINNDGSAKVGYTAPSVNSQSDAVIEALSITGIEAGSISYIEAHGSGTPVGDPIEIAALSKAFKTFTEDTEFCAVGSVKTNVGHLDVSSGLAGLIKTVLALKHQQIPASLNYTEPNPEINFNQTPFYVNSQLTEWDSDALRRAGVMSTGMGGTNAFVILEEAPKLKSKPSSSLPKLLMLSAKTEISLNLSANHLLDFIKGEDQINLDDLTYTLQVGRKCFDHRKYLVCNGREEAIEILQQEKSKKVFSSHLQDSLKRPVVFLLPGIGDHYVGMAYDLYNNVKFFKEEVDKCAQILNAYLDVDIREIIYPKDFNRNKTGASQGIDLKKMLASRVNKSADENTLKLNKTLYAQPALFTIEYALAKLWMHWGITPSAIVGHSMGEYVAACLAGVFSLEDALQMIAKRAKLVNELPVGSMLAVTLSESELLPLLSEDLTISLINGPKLCVVAGPAAAVSEFENVLKEEDIIYRHIQNVHAFHSKMLDPIIDEFTDEVNKIKLNEPQIPYISNVTGTWITNSEATDPAYWSKHANHTARFSDAINNMWQQTNIVLLEIGPGKTLGVLAMQHPERQKTENPVVVSSLRHDYDNQADTGFIMNTLGKLWLSGLEVNWENLYESGRPNRVPLPTYSFKKENYWIEATQLTQAVDQAKLSIHKNPNISEWYYVPSWKRMLPRLNSSDELSTKIGKKLVWLVFKDGTGFGSQLVERLKSAGQEVITVIIGERFKIVDNSTFAINPGDPENYELLIKALQENNKVLDNIVHTWSITKNLPEQFESNYFSNKQELGFYSLVFLTKALGKHNVREAIKLFVLSNNLHEVDGRELLSPEKSTILGPCMVIPQEYPNIKTRSIDLDYKEIKNTNQKYIDQIFGEFLESGSDLFVAYRKNQRWVQSYEPVVIDKPDEKTSIFRKEGVYLITGGLGDIGYEMADYLARTVQAKLVLVGRSKLPGKKDWESWIDTHQENDHIIKKLNKIKKLESLGSEVIYLDSNVADKDRMFEVITKTYQCFKNLDGVIHGAGIVGEKGFSEIQDIDLMKCSLHFQAKAQGLFVLENVLEDKNLDFCMMLSSLTPILGGLGEVAYSSSNIFMDTFTRKHNHLSTVPWISVNWDLWRLEKDTISETGMGKTLAELGITSEEGMIALESVLSLRETPQMVVSTGDLNARINQWVKLESLRDNNGAKKGDIDASSLSERPKLDINYFTPGDETEKIIADIWQDALGIKQVGIKDDFSELGGHSLVAIKIIAGLREAFQIELSVRTLFDAPTVAELAILIKEKILAEIEQLSDEEASQLVSKDLNMEDGQA